MSGRILLVAGARPNFMKIAPILRVLDQRSIPSVLVHTGQHYDRQLSHAMFEDLGIREPDFHLNVGSGTHAEQTGRIMTAFEPVVMEARPEWVVVVGDVNSTLACSLVAAKLTPTVGCRVAHVEAGLRSRDWRMPEEINRVVTDRVADLLLTPSRDADANLDAEGIPRERVRFVGNVMIDTLFAMLPRARSLDVAAREALPKQGFVAVTLHRPSNVDDRDALKVILTALGEVAKEQPVVLPLHPRTRERVATFGLEKMLRPIRVLDSLGYLEMLSLTDSSALVLTDSGGLQEETTALGVPCVTLREQTERPATITFGTNRMAPWPLTVEGIVDAYRKARGQRRYRPGERCPEGWDGKAAERIVDALTETATHGSETEPLVSRA